MSTLKRHPGMAPSAWNAYVNASQQAGINLTEHGTLRVSQAIGNAPASKGFHARDGYVTVDGKRVPYCACTDFSVKWLTIPEIRAWVESLAWWGFAAWYRGGSAWAGNTHIHAVYAGLPMKDQTQRQIVDYLNDRTGLVGHARETFYTGNAEQDAYIRALFNWSNHGGPKPPAPPKAPVPSQPPSLPVSNGYKLLFSNDDRVRTIMPALNGHAMCPVRDWYHWLGIEDEDIVWHPDTQSVVVQGRPVAADIKLLTINGQRNGYATIGELVQFSGLGLKLDEAARSIRIARKKTA